jgi:quercetin dioxygenase-like cupin family protein
VDTTNAAFSTVLQASAIRQLTSAPFGPTAGVATITVLWRDDTSMAGLLTVTAGHHLGRHTHRQNHHHVWVVSGAATIAGTPLGPGGYAHIPAGVEHDIDATDTEGCTMFFLYVRPAP